jgi:hypothetical protein
MSIAEATFSSIDGTNDMRIVEVSTSSCSTEFEVTYTGRLCRVRLWAIVGGLLAMQVDKAPYFTEHFNICELYAGKWIQDSNEPIRGHYVHQDPANPIGPRIEDLVGAANDGYLCFRQFVIKAWQDMAFYEKRAAKMSEVMGGEFSLISGRLHNRAEHEFFKVRFEPYYGDSWRETPVTYTSAHGSGPFINGYSDEYHKYMPQKWITFARKVEKVQQACEKRTKNSPWKINDLNDEEFEQYIEAIREVQGKNVVTA